MSHMDRMLGVGWDLLPQGRGFSLRPRHRTTERDEARWQDRNPDDAGGGLDDQL